VPDAGDREEEPAPAFASATASDAPAGITTGTDVDAGPVCASTDDAAPSVEADADAELSDLSLDASDDALYKTSVMML
jgi:hypothetical protein